MLKCISLTRVQFFPPQFAYLHVYMLYMNKNNEKKFLYDVSKRKTSIVLVNVEQK